jgi:hypothetical protein
MPLFLITAYAKDKKADLTPADKRVMKALTERLKRYGGS